MKPDAWKLRLIKYFAYLLNILVIAAVAWGLYWFVTGLIFSVQS